MANVQPAGVEGLFQAHATLRKDLGELEAAARAPEGAAAEGLADLLRRARAHLVEHFRFEEEDGYLPAVLLRDPNQGRRVEQLRDEHRRLFAALEALLDEAGRGATGAVRPKLLEWVAAVRRHEEREDALVQDVLTWTPAPKINRPTARRGRGGQASSQNTVSQRGHWPRRYSTSVPQRRVNS
jgi:hypothetical protein